MKCSRAFNRLRTWRRQLCIKWRVDAWGMSFKSGEPQNVNPPHYGRKCWRSLIIVWWSTTSFRGHSNQNFSYLANPKLHGFSLQQVLSIHSMRRPWLHHAWTWLVRQREVVNVWHSLSVEDLVGISPSGHVCPGSRPIAVGNYGKGTTTSWWNRLCRHVIAGHRQDGYA